MTCPILLRISCLFSWLMLLAPTHAEPPTPAKPRPNVILIITDDQQEEMMNWLPQGKGKNLTPATDSLIPSATILTHPYVTSPVCTPSRYACLTGQYPSRSQNPQFLTSTQKANGQTVVQWNTFIQPNQPCLPAKFKAAGYRTAIVGKNHVVDFPFTKPNWLADPSSPETRALLSQNSQRQHAALRSIGFDYAASIYYNNPNENGIKALACHNLDWIAKGALDFLKQPTTQPFFLYLATTVPHGPTNPKQSWNADRRITADGLLETPCNTLPPASSYAKRLADAHISSPHAQNTLWLDDLIHALILQLKQSNQFDNTIICYFNDHGQKAKGTLYQGGIHSQAWIWKSQGFAVGRSLPSAISNIDFAPTLLELAGIPFQPSEFDGQSFAPALANSPATERALFFELGYSRAILKGNWKYLAVRYPASAYALTTPQRQSILDEFNADQLKKNRPIHNRDPLQPFSHILLIPGGGDAEHASFQNFPAYHQPDQLYNLSSDPLEQTNLAHDPKHQAILTSLQKELREHLQSLPGSFPLSPPPSPSPSPAPTPPPP